MIKEKAKPRGRKVKGTVLFTVVCVMMVLIVFLLGTLALAATANKRSYRNYQKAQTKANAKAVLDAVIEAINRDDGSAGGYKVQLSQLDAGESIPVTVTSSDSALSNVNVRIYYDSEKTVYNQAKGKWVKGAIYRIEAENTMRSTGEGTTYCAYLADDSIVSGDGPGASGGGGAFVSYGGLGGNENVGTSGFVAGGTEIGLNNTDPFASNYKIENQTIFEAPTYINGNLYISTQSTVQYNKLGDFFAVMGNLVTKNGITFDYGKNLFSTDDGGTWGNSGATDAYSIPAFFVGGTLQNPNDGGIDNDLNIGSANVPTNLYAHDIQFDKGGLVVYGDVYTFGDGESYFKGTARDKALYKWVSKNVKMPGESSASDYSFGNYYSKGSLSLLGNKNYSFGGDVRCEKNVTIEGPTEIGKDLIVGGTLTIKGNLKVHGKIIAGSITKSAGNVECTDIRAYNASGVTLTTTYTGGAKIGEMKTTYTLKSDDGYTNGLKMEYSGDNATMNVSYSYSVEKTVNGITTSEPEQLFNQSVTKSRWDIGKDAGHEPETYLYSAQQVVEDQGWWPDYNNMVTLINNISSSNPVTEDVYSYDIAGKYGNDIYPTGFDDMTLTNKIIHISATPTFETSIAELKRKITFSSEAANPITSTNQTIDGITGKTFDVITKSGKLDGSISTRDLYVDTTDGAILLEIGDVTLTKDIIIDERSGNPCYIFIDKRLWIGSGDRRIITRDYYDLLNAGKEPGAGEDETGLKINEVYTDNKDPHYPNVVIMSAQSCARQRTDGAGARDIEIPYLYVQNNAMITAHVRAPYLFFQYETNGFSMPANTTYTQYDDNGGAIVHDIYGKEVAVGGFSDRKKSQVALIGQLIANEIKVTNMWGMMYVTYKADADDDDDDDDDDGGDGAGRRGVPDRLIPMYYNYY